MIEQILSQIDELTGSVEDTWRQMRGTLLDILNNEISKMEIAPRNTVITQITK